MLTREELKEFLSYDRDTGIFVWIKPSGNRVRSGDIAGNFDNLYIKICISGRRYRAHHLAWLYEYGEFPKLIDHINGNKTDNRIENLRLATTSQNAMNSKMFSNNTSGVKGVNWIASRNRWRVQIKRDGITYFGGRFKTIEEAEVAARNLRDRLHGEFSNSG